MKKAKTAVELMAELERDPDYQSRLRDKDATRQARIAQMRTEAAPVLAELVRRARNSSRVPCG
jgi:hypothetical protein